MPGRISGAGVVLGVGTTSVVFLALFFRLGAPLYPIMFVEGLVVGTPAWYAHAVLATLPVLASWLLTFFLGGVVTGRKAGAYPGLNGAMCAAVAMLGIFALFVAPEAHWFWYPVSDLGDAQTRSESLGLLSAWVGVLCRMSPFAILGGYLGGRVGGRLRARSTTTP